MRELTLVANESTDAKLVFVDENDERFFVSVTDTLKAALRRPAPQAVDERLSAPLTMPPREIQARIRAGASAEELAEEMGVLPQRVEPYAHPVMLERTRIAEMARASHPVRADGPASLSLSEILATAFGARGHSLSEATWDAFKEPDGEWVVRLSWQAGLSENEAEWTFHRTNPPTTEARNSIAQDLIDPDFVQPVRSLTSIRYEEAHTVPEEKAEDEFLQHPNEHTAPHKRRKAVTPHWEDVLLGVRTNRMAKEDDK